MKPGATLITDGHASYAGLVSDYRFDPRVIRKMAAHLALPWIHRVFSLMRRWGLGTYHGFRHKHIDTYLNEFVFRYNRRRLRDVSFETTLGLAAHRPPTDYWKITGKTSRRKGCKVERRSARRRRTAEGFRRDRLWPGEHLAERVFGSETGYA